MKFTILLFIASVLLAAAQDVEDEPTPVEQLQPVVRPAPKEKANKAQSNKDFQPKVSKAGNMDLFKPKPQHPTKEGREVKVVKEGKEPKVAITENKKSLNKGSPPASPKNPKNQKPAAGPVATKLHEPNAETDEVAPKPQKIKEVKVPRPTIEKVTKEVKTVEKKQHNKPAAQSVAVKKQHTSSSEESSEYVKQQHWVSRRVHKFFKSMLHMINWDSLNITGLSSENVHHMHVKEMFHCISSEQRKVLEHKMVTCQNRTKEEQEKHIDHKKEAEHHLNKEEQKRASHDFIEVMEEQCFIRSLVAAKNDSTKLYYVNDTKTGELVDHLLGRHDDSVMSEITHCVHDVRMDGHGVVNQFFKHHILVKVFMSTLIEEFLNGKRVNDIPMLQEMNQELPLYKGVFCMIEALMRHKCMNQEAVERVTKEAKLGHHHGKPHHQMKYY